MIKRQPWFLTKACTGNLGFMTPERFKKISTILQYRQPDLTLCLEKVNKAHNISAIARTADAVGVHAIHAIWPTEQMQVTGETAMGSQQWVRLYQHDSIEQATQQFKQDNMQIVITNLSDTAIDYREVDYTKPTAIVLGQEKFGSTEAAIALADQQIMIPMFGMVQSLNVSVASALILYEAQRQRQLAGLYHQQLIRLSKQEQDYFLFVGGHQQLAQVCITKKLPFPEIDAQGEVQASSSWWQKIQSSS